LSPELSAHFHAVEPTLYSTHAADWTAHYPADFLPLAPTVNSTKRTAFDAASFTANFGSIDSADVYPFIPTHRESVAAAISPAVVSTIAPTDFKPHSAADCTTHRNAQ
jgi:hypothetical protein